MMREKYKDGGIKGEIEDIYQKFKMEGQAKDEGAGPSASQLQCGPAGLNI